MAKNLDDYDFWLPSQFLTDNDLLMDFKVSSIVEGRNDGVKYLARDFQHGLNPFGLQSDLSSPVESAIGSVDTESDEEEYITELTRKMAHSTLHDSCFRYQNTKGWRWLGSPQSTLCGCKQGSSSESPNCPSQASSPPPMNQNDRAFDLLYAAADEVARLRIMEDAAGFYQTKTGLTAAPEKTSTVPVVPNKSKQFFGSLNSNQLSYRQLQVAQFQRLKQQQIMKQGQGVLGSGKGGFGQYMVNQNHQKLGQSRGQNGVARPMNSSNFSWPTLQQSQQQQPGSGMHAVFLGNPGPKKECAGTGVFLPRRIGTQTETKKKLGNTTVLLPDRVVQALNLNLGAMDARSQTQVQPRYYNGGSGSIPASGSRCWNNMAATQQRNNSRTENTYSQRATMPQELLLPQDWTY